MNFQMVEELIHVFESIENNRQIRSVILRGAEHHFCSGGDVKDMAMARQAEAGDDGIDPLAKANRQFGRLIEIVNQCPQAVIAIAEGAVLGGGFGLVCVSDIAIAVEGVEFGLPETGLGIPPAQIAPFIVQRIGLTQARRLAVTGGRVQAREALQLGLIHNLVDNEDDLLTQVAVYQQYINRCAPEATAITKQLVLNHEQKPMSQLLDDASQAFALAARGDEGVEGMMAFIQKRLPHWAVEGNQQ